MFVRIPTELLDSCWGRFIILHYFFCLHQGDWAWLKRLPDGAFSNINPKTSNVFELVGRIVNKSTLATEMSITLKDALKTLLCSYR